MIARVVRFVWAAILVGLAGCHEAHFAEDACIACGDSPARDAMHLDAFVPEIGRDGSIAVDAVIESPDAVIEALDAASACPLDATFFASEVVAHRWGTGQNYNQERGFPEALLGPPIASYAPSVVSLGNGGTVTLSFGGNAIVDGEGPDFIVFENPLPGYVELATVAVSDDGETWAEFPCTASQEGPDFGFCAGVHVVFSSPSNGIDPRDPDVAGGDLYDLQDLGLVRARYVRITDRIDLDGPAGVFDLDAIAIIHPLCH